MNVFGSLGTAIELEQSHAKNEKLALEFVTSMFCVLPRNTLFEETAVMVDRTLFCDDAPVYHKRKTDASSNALEQSSTHKV
jgi:hypothetical protein